MFDVNTHHCLHIVRSLYTCTCTHTYRIIIRKIHASTVRYTPKLLYTHLGRVNLICNCEQGRPLTCTSCPLTFMSCSLMSGCFFFCRPAACGLSNKTLFFYFFRIRCMRVAFGREPKKKACPNGLPSFLVWLWHARSC